MYQLVVYFRVVSRAGFRSGSGWSLSICFGPAYKTFFITFRVRQRFYLSWSRFVVLTMVTFVSEVTLTFLQLILFANTAACFRSLLGLVSPSFWEGNSSEKISTRWRCLEKINHWPEVAGVTFSDSDSAPVPQFLNPDSGPDTEIFQIWESYSSSDSSYHRSNRNLPVLYLRNDHADSYYCQNWEVDPGPVFNNFFTAASDPGPKEKRRILPETTPARRIHGNLCHWRDSWLI